MYPHTHLVKVPAANALMVRGVVRQQPPMQLAPERYHSWAMSTNLKMRNRMGNCRENPGYKEKWRLTRTFERHCIQIPDVNNSSCASRSDKMWICLMVLLLDRLWGRISFFESQIHVWEEPKRLFDCAAWSNQHGEG